MARLLDIPDELLVHIVQCLPHLLDVERMAGTLNKRIYPVCLPLLRARMAQAGNAKRVVELSQLWSAHIYQRHVGWSHMHEEERETMYDNSGIDQTLWGPYHPIPDIQLDKPLENYEFLELNGDLYWLQDPGEQMHHRFLNDEEDKIARALPRLLAQAAKLGLVVPAEFVRLMGSSTLTTWIPFDEETIRWTLGRFQSVCLRTSPSGPFEVIPGAYVVRFLIEYCGTDVFRSWHLYLDQSGTSLVLIGYPSDMSSSWAADQLVYYQVMQFLHAAHSNDIEDDPENKEGHEWTYGVEVHGTSFEEFLARTYLIEQSRYWLSGGPYLEDRSPRPDGHEWPNGPAKLPITVKQFVLSTYSAHGRSSWRDRTSMRELYRV
jgi:hypothetical protein